MISPYFHVWLFFASQWTLYYSQCFPLQCPSSGFEQQGQQVCRQASFEKTFATEKRTDLLVYKNRLIGLRTACLSCNRAPKWNASSNLRIELFLSICQVEVIYRKGERTEEVHSRPTNGEILVASREIYRRKCIEMSVQRCCGDLGKSILSESHTFRFGVVQECDWTYYKGISRLCHLTRKRVTLRQRGNSRH